MPRHRRYHRNPTSAKPANWASMSRQERKAWNKADFAASRGARTSSKKSSRSSGGRASLDAADQAWMRKHAKWAAFQISTGEYNQPEYKRAKGIAAKIGVDLYDLIDQYL